GVLGMSPGAYKQGGRGRRIAYALADSPLGRLLVAATEQGLCALRFGQDDALEQELRTEFPHATLAHDPAAVAPYVRAVLAYLAGRQIGLDLPLDVDATAFQRRVWTALRQIPYGETRSYSEVAQMIGQPSAARAVAQACARNPVALVVPCHRVVGAAGAIGGYRWGIQRKRSLLDREHPSEHPSRPKHLGGERDTGADGRWPGAHDRAVRPGTVPAGGPAGIVS
ncbi:MAG: methylated-DNA--[protein]-cysteine S-methyltransferase, partial [Chloroflexota bacterium]